MEIPTSPGFGTWDLDDEAAENAVYLAIKVGYRMIDTASIYRNERGVGRGIARAVNEGICTRPELFIQSKLWITSCMSHASVESALNTSLAKLGLSYLDCYLHHWPYCAIPSPDDPEGLEAMHEDNDPSKPLKLYASRSLTSIWKSLERCQDHGLTRHIGLSNYTIKMVDDILQMCHIKPYLLQVECHVRHQQSLLLSEMRARNIIFQAYSPLGGRRCIEQLISLPVIDAIAQKHGVSPADILLAFHSHRGEGYCFLVKSCREERILSNFQTANIELSDEDLAKIAELDEGRKLFDSDRRYFGHPIPWDVEKRFSAESA